MATDRFVKLRNLLPREDVRKALEGYLNRAATVEWNEDRWLVTFPQTASDPLRDLNREFYFVRADGTRFFEVWCDATELDVITRQQDEFVSAVADGFYAFVKRYWGRGS